MKLTKTLSRLETDGAVEVLVNTGALTVLLLCAFVWVIGTDDHLLKITTGRWVLGTVDFLQDLITTPTQLIQQVSRQTRQVSSIVEFHSLTCRLYLRSVCGGSGYRLSYSY